MNNKASRKFRTRKNEKVFSEASENIPQEYVSFFRKII
jgi:hypothetical protein